MSTGLWQDHVAYQNQAPCRRNSYASAASIERFAHHTEVLLANIREKRATCQHQGTYLKVQLADDQAGFDEDTYERRCVDCNRLISWGEEAQR